MSDKLQLEVILSAIDRASRPFRAMSKGSGELAKTLRKSKDALAALNAVQSRISGFRKLRNETDASRLAFAAATQTVKALRAQHAAAAEPTKKLTRALESAERATVKSKNAHIANLSALKRHSAGLAAAGIQTGKLSQHERDLAAKIASANALIDKQTAKLSRLAESNRKVQRAQQAYQNAQSKAGNMRSFGASAMAGGVAAAAGPLAAVRAASDFEQAMLGVARQVNGARDEGGKLTPVYYDLASAIQTMSQRLPMASTEIAALVAAGARMGIQGRENLLTFAETTAIAANAFELPADEIGDNLAKIATLYKIPIKNIRQLGDTLDFLDDNTDTKGREIIEVLQRMGDVSDKLDYRKAAAFGSTFVTLGSAPEVAASATKALVRELSIAAIQPKKFQAAMSELGLNSEQIQRRMTTDAAGTIQMVLEKINAAAPDQRVSLATRIFGKEFGDDATKLALNLGQLNKQIALTTDPRTVGSMAKANDARLQTMAGRYAMLKNQAFNTAVVLGTNLAPTMLQLMTVTGDVLTRVQAWVQQNPALAGGLMKAALAGGAVLAVVGGLSIVISTLMTPVAALRYGVTLLSLRFGPLLRQIVPLARNAFPMLLQGARLLLPVLGGISAPMLLIGAAVVAVGVLIYKYWQPIKAFMTGVFQGIGAAARPVFAELATLLAPLRPVWDWFVGILGVAWNWLKQFVQPVQSTSAELQAATGYGRAFGAVLGGAILTPLKMTIGAVSTLWSWLKIAFNYSPLGVITSNWNAIIGFLSGLWPRFKSIGGQIISGLVQGIQSQFPLVTAAVKMLGKLLPDTISKKLDINSPSRVFEGIGQYTAQGLAVGITRNANLPVRAVDQLQGRVRAAGEGLARGAGIGGGMGRSAPAGATGGQGGRAAGVVNHYEFTIHAPGGDPVAIKRAVQEALAQAERAGQAKSRSALSDRGD